jgi:hypothetical protein
VTFRERVNESRARGKEKEEIIKDFLAVLSGVLLVFMMFVFLYLLT